MSGGFGHARDGSGWLRWVVTRSVRLPPGVSRRQHVGSIASRRPAARLTASCAWELA